VPLVREQNRLLHPVEWLSDDRIVYLSGAVKEPFNWEIKVLDRGASAGRFIAAGISPAVSRDGRWLAYASTATGERNVVVQSFSTSGPRTQVSAGGGADPAWSPDGRTLYYLGQPDAKLLSVDIRTAPLAASAPREYPGVNLGTCAQIRCYDLSADGTRFLFGWFDRSAPRESVTRVDLALNWLEGLKQRVPAK
jgi:serine/threonine-protein kinase